MQSRCSFYRRIGLTLALALLSLGQVSQAQERSPFPFPACASDPFTDVPMSDPFCPFIKQLSADQITSGCGTGIYCPNNPLTRGQMAVFLEKAMRGTAAWSVGNVGNGNTRVGSDALASPTLSGNFNTASGSAALNANTTGFWNTASGGQALSANTIGYFNTASGASALRDNTEGNRNTASGASALRSNTSGFNNTASGAFALGLNSTGRNNTASGAYALRDNTTGRRNTASGAYALDRNSEGTTNTASGAYALRNNTTGYSNTAIGARALYYNTGSARIIALGYRAGYNTTGNDNILIGNQGVAAESAKIRIGTLSTHSDTFIAGIRGNTTGIGDAANVVIDSLGELGTLNSSRRFKQDIEDVAGASHRLLALRPVRFRYKEHAAKGDLTVQYGLIAEEVAEVFPELAVYDHEGRPETVKYHLLSVLLLNELKNQKAATEARDRAQATRLETAEERFTAGEARIAAVEAREREQTSLVQAMQAELASWRRQQAELATGSEREPVPPPGR